MRLSTVRTPAIQAPGVPICSAMTGLALLNTRFHRPPPTAGACAGRNCTLETQSTEPRGTTHSVGCPVTVAISSKSAS